MFNLEHIRSSLDMICTKFQFCWAIIINYEIKHAHTFSLSLKALETPDKIQDIKIFCSSEYNKIKFDE